MNPAVLSETSSAKSCLLHLENDVRSRGKRGNWEVLDGTTLVEGAPQRCKNDDCITFVREKSHLGWCAGRNRLERKRLNSSIWVLSIQKRIRRNDHNYRASSPGPVGRKL